jgi:hypothetical protein
MSKDLYTCNQTSRYILMTRNTDPSVSYDIVITRFENDYFMVNAHLLPQQKVKKEQGLLSPCIELRAVW